MTLILALMLISGLDLGWGWYPVAIFGWLCHLEYHSKSSKEKQSNGNSDNLGTDGVRQVVH